MLFRFRQTSFGQTPAKEVTDSGFGLIFPATHASEDVVAQELHSDTVTAVPLRLHAQNRSAGAETKNRAVPALGRGQPHGERHLGSFAHHPFEPQVQAADAQVLKYGLFLEGLIVHVYTPQPRVVSGINSRTRPSFLHQL